MLTMLRVFRVADWLGKILESSGSYEKGNWGMRLKQATFGRTYVCSAFVESAVGTRPVVRFHHLQSGVFGR